MVQITKIGQLFFAIKNWNMNRIDARKRAVVFRQLFAHFYFSSVASLRPINTPMTEAIINPRVHPLESPSE